MDVLNDYRRRYPHYADDWKTGGSYGLRCGKACRVEQRHQVIGPLNDDMLNLNSEHEASHEA
eukprot:1153782-Pelagomonas_calceolata.AAC.1